MNREIKFRVLDKNKNKIYRVVILCDSFNDFCEVPYCHYENEKGELEFLPLTEGKLIQYIGLTDRNGKDVYDGDIIKDSKGKVYKITWGYDLLWLAQTKEIHCCCYCPKSLINHGAVVIGNIYEDKDLLEE